MVNETSDFLGADDNWYNVVITLDEVHPLHGGIQLTVKGSGQVSVTLVKPRGQQTKYRFFINQDECQRLKQLLLEHNFLTIQPEERLGIPDEARPTITIKNAQHQSHRVAKWAGVQNDRFDPIYDILGAIAAQIQDHKPLSQPEARWLTVVKVLSIGLLAISIIFLARAITHQIVLSTDPQSPSDFLVPVASMTVVVPLLLGICVVLEWLMVRQKSFFSRPNSLILVVLGILYTINLTMVIPFFLDVGMLHWGISTPATIQTKFTSTSYDSETGVSDILYNLRYQYQTSDNKRYTGRSSVKPSAYQRVHEGDTVTVYYLPGFPRWSTLEPFQAVSSRSPFLIATLLTLIGWISALGFISYVILPVIQSITARST
ncbi:MAG: DUF3592 domain-containing protein [Elainellaceae cyanobacterium]